MTIEVRAAQAVPQHGATLGWALRRAALGMAILTVTVSALAWLMYATIEPDPASAHPAHSVSSTRN